jgi:hypothetical protein
VEHYLFICFINLKFILYHFVIIFKNFKQTLMGLVIDIFDLYFGEAAVFHCEI